MDKWQKVVTPQQDCGPRLGPCKKDLRPQLHQQSQTEYSEVPPDEERPSISSWAYARVSLLMVTDGIYQVGAGYQASCQASRVSYLI